MTDRLTLEAHGAASRHEAVGGMGAAWLMGTLGEISGSFSASTGESGGRQWTLGYSWRSGNFHFSADLRRATRGFRDISSRWGAGPPLAIENVQFGYSSRVLGGMSLGYLRLRQADDVRSRFGMFNWSRPLFPGLTINANLRQNLEKRADRAAFLSLGLTPGANRHVSLGLQSQGGTTSYAASMHQSPQPEGGIGWRADLQGSEGQWRSQAQISMLGDHGEAYARVEAMPGSRSAHAGLSGSLALLDGAVFASRRIEDGFALVSTGDAAGVPVLVQNRPVGKSGKDGRLLVTQLLAFQENAIGIDPVALDGDYTVDAISAVAVPSDRSGVRVAFPIRQTRSALATVSDRSGTFIPAGSLARIEGREEPATIGFDGLLYLEQPMGGARVTIDLESGPCTFLLPKVIAPGTQTRLGTLVCETVQ